MLAPGVRPVAGTGMPSGELEVGGRRYRAWVEDNLVRVQLPFTVDLRRLSELLDERGLFLARRDDEELARTGDQGWARHFDPDDYYPFYVEAGRDGGSIFSFPPEDYDELPDGSFAPRLGDGARAVLERWLPLLEQAREDPR